MITTTKKLLDAAYGKYSVGAYNIHNLEQLMGLMRGAEKSKAPFIVQVYPSTQSYTSAGMYNALFREAEKEFPELLFSISLDHGDEADCMSAIDSGVFTNVMIDASMESFDINVAITKRVVEYAHVRGISVEGMIGRLGGAEKHMKMLEEFEVELTDPKEAAEFVRLTGVDSLGVSVGTLHGKHKSSGADPRSVKLDVLKAIQDALPNVPLVLHGSSCLHKHERDRVDATGGHMERVGGMNEGEQRAVAKLGVAQINVNSDGFLLWTRVHREFFHDQPNVIDFRESGKAFMEEYANFIAHKNSVFGSANKLI